MLCIQSKHVLGGCYTTSGRLAQESLSRPFQRLTSSASRTCLGSHLGFSDPHILSFLQHTAYTHRLHVNRPSLRIYLSINAHPLTASPRHPDATMTIQMTRQPNPIFSHGPETFSLAHEIDEIMKSSSCGSIAQL
jgi:hypothetical protein